MSRTGKFLAVASAVALALGIAAQGLVVFADTNNPAPWHAHYFTENVEFKVGVPGDTFQFVVQYSNGGQSSWVKGAPNQEARLGTGWTFGDPLNPSDNSNDFNGGWSLGWLSSTRITAQQESTVLPATNATFTFVAKIPANASSGRHQIKAQPVIDGVQWLENYGYYQGFDVSTTVTPPPIPVPTSPPTGIPCTGSNPCVSSAGTPTGTARVQVCFNHGMATSDGFAVNDISHFSISGGPAISGVTSSDGTCTVLALASGLAKDQTATLVVTDVADSGGFMITPNPTNVSFTATDGTKPTATSLTQPGTYSLLVKFSEAIDPSTATAGAFRIDSATWPGTITLNSGNTSFGLNFGTPQAPGVTTIDPNTEVRLDWPASAPPGNGSHSLDVRDVKDAAGNVLATNPTTFTFTISGGTSDTSAPSASANAFQSARQSGSVGTFAQFVNVEWSKGVAVTTNGYAAANSANTLSNYALQNPDGNPATTTCVTGGPALTVASLSLATDDESRFELRRVTLRLSALVQANCTYTLKISNVKDEVGNIVTPNPLSVPFFAGPDTALPTVSTAKASTSRLLVVFSKDLLGSASALVNGNYTSSVATLQDRITGAGSPVLNSSGDGTTVIFTFASSLTSGSYPLTVQNVKDPAGNTMTMATLTLTFQDTQPPTLQAAALIGASSFSMTFSKPVQAGSNTANSAANGSNYSVNNKAFGALCNTGALVITADSTGSMYTIACSGGAGVWSTTAGSNVVQVRNVADIAGNVINPNPSSKGF